MLVVDDFGIKYVKNEDLDHLIKALELHYDVALDKEGKDSLKLSSPGTMKKGKCPY